MAIMAFGCESVYEIHNIGELFACNSRIIFAWMVKINIVRLMFNQSIVIISMLF